MFVAVCKCQVQSENCRIALISQLEATRPCRAQNTTARSSVGLRSPHGGVRHLMQCQDSHAQKRECSQVFMNLASTGLAAQLDRSGPEAAATGAHAQCLVSITHPDRDAAGRGSSPKYRECHGCLSFLSVGSSSIFQGGALLFLVPRPLQQGCGTESYIVWSTSWQEGLLANAEFCR